MRIGSYEVVSTLGKGAMGVVHAARSPEGRSVAIKVLHRSKVEAAARFERERRLLASFGETEGFVPLLDAGTTPAGPYIVMPLVPGGTLRQKLRVQQLGIEETIALGRALAAAIGVAHARGVVHRDLKPENILFTAEGRPLVADLGVAKHFDTDAPGGSQSVSLSVSGQVFGTAGYMAPEQIDDAKSVGPAADVFALGAILYECLAGRPAFQGVTVVEILACVCGGVTPSAREARPETPDWLEAVVRRALAPKPVDRFEDGAALARALGHASEAPRRGRVLLLVTAVALLVAAVGLVVARPRPEAPSSHLTAAGLASQLTEALATARSGRAREAGALVARARAEDPALALEAALEIARKLGESHDWPGLATASQLFLPLAPSAEGRRPLEDGQLAADFMASAPRGALEKLKQGCRGRTDLEASVLGPIVERLYAKALEPRPSATILVELYPLPPSRAQRAAVAAACFKDVLRLKDLPVPDVAARFQVSGEILDRLRCACAADPRILTLPEELHAPLESLLVTGSIAADKHDIPVDWEGTFTGDGHRPGFPEHPLHFVLRSRVKLVALDFEGALADARKALEAVGEQRTRPARLLAQLVVVDEYKGLDRPGPEVLALMKKFAEVADTRFGWTSLAEECEAGGDPGGVREALARAATAGEIPD